MHNRLHYAARHEKKISRIIVTIFHIVTIFFPKKEDDVRTAEEIGLNCVNPFNRYQCFEKISSWFIFKYD